MAESNGHARAAAGPEVVVAGYASIDRVFEASAPPVPGRTALLRGAVDVPPRFGGCGPTAARQLARLGCRTGLVSWLGDDAPGRAYLRALAEEGVDVRGVLVAAGATSPRSYLFYDPAGGATCYYHPSASPALGMHDGARAMLATAGVLALTVGPAGLTEALLDARQPDVRVGWSVKADPDAYPEPLRRRLLAEADVVCLNRTELPFLTAALDQPPGRDEEQTLAVLRRATGAVVVLTAGADGCRVAWAGGDVRVPASPVAVADPTGAGDVFFGAFVAAWYRGAEPDAAARSATDSTRSFLQAREVGQEAP